MRCPRCKADVLWTALEAVPGGIKLYDRGEFVTMVAVNADEIVRMKSGFAVTPHECAEREKTDDELRMEFWEHARTVALNFDCPRCNQPSGVGCVDLRYKREPNPRTEWPHKERFIDRIDRKILLEARTKAWL